MLTDIEAALIGINHLAERLGRLVRLSDLRHWLAGHEFPRSSENLPNVSRRFGVR
jgi:hypothetical protein